MEVVISPGIYTHELDNPHLRASRGRIPGKSSLPKFGGGPGLLVAISDVNLRVKTASGGEIDVVIGAGKTRWLKESTASVRNLGGADCEFLFIETKN